MSRIGLKPIPLPEKVQVALDENNVQVEGPKGSLDWQLPEGIDVALDENVLTVQRKSELKHYKALHGLARSLIANMVTGVSEGFEKKLRVVGTGYRAEVNRENNLVLDVGYSHAVTYAPPDGITLSVEPSENIDGQAHTPIVVTGIDKQLVGQVAASIRQIRKPDTYKPCKGIRYEGERVRDKEGKAAV
ncbi:MAG: 50S ribosomal protein L6 [Candidatus Poribacteria bacterium]|nr:50S ribosomal protein L6 [Candidatus Poribacteria bacterium]MYK16567.1 50S ribosomal protein L6 [Candidatus Poribacteria bacterium]